MGMNETAFGCHFDQIVRTSSVTQRTQRRGNAQRRAIYVFEKQLWKGSARSLLNWRRSELQIGRTVDKVLKLVQQKIPHQTKHRRTGANINND